MRRSEASRGELLLTTSTLSSSAQAAPPPRQAIAEGRASSGCDCGCGCGCGHEDAVGGADGGADGCGGAEPAAPSLPAPAGKAQAQTQPGVARAKLESGGAEGVAERGRRCNASGARREPDHSSRAQVVPAESGQYELAPGKQTHRLMLEPEAEQGAAQAEEKHVAGRARGAHAAADGQGARVVSEPEAAARGQAAPAARRKADEAALSPTGQQAALGAGDCEQPASNLLSPSDCLSIRSASPAPSASSASLSPPPPPARRHVPQYMFNETTFYSQPVQAIMPQLASVPLAAYHLSAQLAPACHFSAGLHGHQTAGYYPAQLMAPPLVACPQHCCMLHYAQPAGHLCAARSQAANMLLPHPHQPPPQQQYQVAESVDAAGAAVQPSGVLWLPAGMLAPQPPPPPLLYDCNYLALGSHLAAPSLHLAGNYHTTAHFAASMPPPPPPPGPDCLQSPMQHTKQVHLANSSAVAQASGACQLKLSCNLMRLLPIDAQPARRRQAYGMDKVWQDEFGQLFAQLASNITWTLVEVEKNPDIRQHSHRLLAYKSRYIVRASSNDGGSTSGQGSSLRSSADSTTSSRDVQLQAADSESVEGSRPSSGNSSASKSLRSNSKSASNDKLDSECCAPDGESACAHCASCTESGETCSEDGDEFGHCDQACGPADALELADSSSTINSATESISCGDEEQQAAEPLALGESSDAALSFGHEQAKPKTKHGFPLRFRMFIDSAKVRFCCENCGHGWTSMKGRVVFWYELFELVDDELALDHETTTYPAQALGCANLIGYCAYKLFGQQCDVCKVENRFESPMWYPEEVAKVLNNLYNKIGQVYFGFKMPAIDRQRRAGKPKTSHNSSLCQACLDGVCADRK